MYRTEKEALTKEDIAEYIYNYESVYVPKYTNLLAYYKGKNTKIVSKQAPDPNNPDNRTPVPYGKKIVTTFTGYAYRPRYITYKSDNEAYLKSLQQTFNESNEHIKTSMHGKDTGIYGVSYELLYLGKSKTTTQAEVKMAVIDPREMILIYDYAIEPEKKIAIRFYSTAENAGSVQVYYNDRIEYYNFKRVAMGIKPELVYERTEANFFGEIPVIKFSMVDEMGVIEPVLPLIDDYDALVSDSMNEFDRFSHAYLRLVGMSLTDQVKSASPGTIKSALQLLKYRRSFEQLKNKEDVSFLTKDIPTDYIKFMTDLVREQIHVQSHVPDLGKDKEMSGIAVQRLMFDFENVVSSAEAEFDTALYERIRLITKFYNTVNRPAGTFDEITISHKRNAPLNLKEFADTAEVMKRAGFSSYLCADIMPDDIVPDVDEELKRQEEENDMIIPDIEKQPPAQDIEEADEFTV